MSSPCHDLGYSLHVTWATDGSRSGGSIAAMRTVEALRAVGCDARVAAVRGRGASDAPLPPHWAIDNLLQRATQRVGMHDVHRLSSLAVLSDAVWQGASIVHLHIIHSGVFNYALLPLLCRGKQVFITLHDMWPFTGNCIYSYDCERWRAGCGRCPYPDRYPAMQRDASALGWHAKRWAFRRLELNVIAPSRWLAQCARESMLGAPAVHHLPYPIDTEAFRPRDRRAARARWGIELDRFVLLFSAHDLTDFRKGGEVVPRAVAALPAPLRQRTTVVTFGATPVAPGGMGTGVRTVHLGFLSSDDDKADALSAADLLVFPSRADNLPLVVQEAIACGTPVVASDVGGMRDLARPGVTGELVAVDDVTGFRDAIERWAADPQSRDAAARACRSIAQAEYGYETVGRALQQLYAQAISRDTSARTSRHSSRRSAPSE